MTIVYPTALPRYNQQYPGILLPSRVELYITDDGQPPTPMRTKAKLVMAADALVTLRAAKQTAGPSYQHIDDRYYLGTLYHEAGCANEWDIERATPSSPTGFHSVGAYQIGAEEAERFGYKLEDMLDFGKATDCMLQLAEANRMYLINSARALHPSVQLDAKVNDVEQDLAYTDNLYRIWEGGQLRAFLAIAHNHGCGFAHKAIAAWGLSWGAYQAHLPADNIVAHAYGEDCVTGGPRWPQTEPNTPDRLLHVMTPMMTGLDVKLAQRIVGLPTITGSYDLATEDAVKAWQLTNRLYPDGLFGRASWRTARAQQAGQP